MRPSTWALLVGVAILGLGCGSSSRPATHTKSSALTKAQYIAQADAVCKAGRASIDPLVVRLTAIQGQSTGNVAQDFAKASAVVAEMITVTQRYLAQMVALKPPAELAARVARWLDLQARLTTILRRAKSAADAQDSTRFKAAFVEVNRVGAERSAVAAGIGLKVCGNGNA